MLHRGVRSLGAGGLGRGREPLKRKTEGRGIYAAYFFREHDPKMDAVDRLYELAGVIGQNGKPRFAQIAEESGVSETTIRNWRKRKTKRPTNAAQEAVIRGLGGESTITYNGQTIHYGASARGKLQLSVIDGGALRRRA